MSEHISLKICKSCGGILEMQRISRKAETHHPLDNRSLEGRCVKEDVPHIPKRLLSDCKLLCYFFFFFLDAQFARPSPERDHVSAPSHASVSPPAHPL